MKTDIQGNQILQKCIEVLDEENLEILLSEL
jgi:hypothetical protein